ncbi:tRNA glutamyl-Q synthetase [Xanthomonas translucens pv. arrhenatheri]|uniref:Glutamyl-Q tRNA(Asp) synthetase n=1 Tax=Xanthomonas graminis pv. arrhenatheri LMG 727 TaxID=1195923 RepID=A0A0K2ZDS1_9XANT|nr:tRNA glutamyl-Q(34) synthetase GluQRS [Xanthomonas translucens]OAX64703.1 tRNA glutamyl-Q synthetase [Xanthomonas translucens pv. arrhenatheri]UKE79114.1 tRNA glutamyl-Q(34) synthetase GluQRS [Xanthomonas translucens pv. arrhenatheri]CTP83721.1 Glutamyl-Q tRNA(Asp) synthetase [Xanthomonas translucens pv. arrhenatheri LMG 727]
MSSPPYRGRFAPSPTGPLHLGSLLAAFGSWLLARHAGGEWLLRIEDVDRPRSVPGAAARQLASLRACGLEADGPVLRQSERAAAYQAAAQRLLQTGQAFACSCSRSELAAQGIHHRCVAAQTRPQPALRLRVAPGSAIGFRDGLRGDIAQDVHAEVGDFVLLRADGCWAYQLAVVVDDAAQGISDVVRGADLLDSTPRQILLQRALGLPTPHYLHLPLLLGADGRKLSKSHAALPLDDADPLPALRLAWTLLGQAPAALSAAGSVAALLAAALRAFEPARLPAQDRTLAEATGIPSDAKAD